MIPSSAAEVEVVEGERAVGADAVPGRPVAVRPHRDHRGRGLLRRPCARSPATSTPSRASRASRRVARSGRRRRRRRCAPRRRAGRAPRRCRRRCRPGDIRIVSTSWPSEPSGIDSMPITWVSRTCTPTVAIFMLFSCGGAVAAPQRRLDHGGLLGLGEDARRAERAGAVVQRGQPLEQQRVLDGLVEGRADGDRAVVGHQRGLPVRRAPRDAGGQLGRAERRVRRHPDRAAEQQLLVVEDRQLVEHAGDRGGVRRVGVHDGGGAGVGVDAEVQVELGGRDAGRPRPRRRRGRRRVTSSARAVARARRRCR